MLQVKNISFNYPQEESVFTDLSFSIPKGKTLAIVGPSGQGKSTLLKLIYGLLAPTTGEITWDNEVIPNPKDELVPGFKKMKLVEQDFNLMPFIKVFENIQQHILHLQEEERKPFLDYWLKFLQIQHIETKKAKDLSGGQMQRVAIAKGLISKPELILLDEPFSNLDTLTKSYLVSDLKKHLNQSESTSILVVHQPEDALEIADEILVLSNGKIDQIDNPKTIYNKPKTKTTAGLFGVCNFFSEIEAKEILSFTPHHKVEGEFLVRPHQLNISQIKASYKIKDSIFLGSTKLIRLSAKGKDIWISEPT